MDTLTTPVLLVTIVTNSRKARFSIGASECYIGEATESTSQSASEVSLRQSATGFSLRQLVFGIRVSQPLESEDISHRSETSVQCSSVSGIQEATNVKCSL
jgi:hypothetical protein